MKPAKKRTRILFLCILFCFVLYQILFPVRTLREVLEAREIYNLSDSYERKEYEDTYVLPEALPGLQQDVLGVRGTLPSFYDFELLSSQDTDQICKLLSSLKVRKKLGKYHGFSTQHRLENGYEYWIRFSWVSNLTITLCQKELCFETSPAFRYGSEKFNVYYLINSNKLPGKSGSAGRARKLFAADLLVTKGLEYKKEHHLRVRVMLLFFCADFLFYR